MEMGELLKEYESIPKRRLSGGCTIALLPESGDKNRFQDVLPYDDTRVELVPTKENNTGYINASHIKVSYAEIFCDLTDHFYMILFLITVAKLIHTQKKNQNDSAHEDDVISKAEAQLC